MLEEIARKKAEQEQIRAEEAVARGTRSRLRSERNNGDCVTVPH